MSHIGTNVAQPCRRHADTLPLPSPGMVDRKIDDWESKKELMLEVKNCYMASTAREWLLELFLVNNKGNSLA